MKKITLAALALGAALAFAGSANAERSLAPSETSQGKARVAVAGFVQTSSGKVKSFSAGNNGYTRQLWESAPYSKISRR